MKKQTKGSGAEPQPESAADHDASLIVTPTFQTSAKEFPGHQHRVLFFDTEAVLYEEVTSFLAEGLRSGDAILIVATAAHLEQIESHLVKRGHELEDARANGQVLMLEARQVLSKFMLDGRADASLFAGQISPIIEKSLAGGRHSRIRIYGEMVDVLWGEGNSLAAIELEGLWNDLARKYPFTLLCSYAMAGFFKSARGDGVQKVFRTHSHLFSAESVLRSEAEGVPAEGGQLLRERIQNLERELDARRELEGALRQAISERRRAEEVLRESQEQLSDFLENAAEGFHWVGPDGQVLWANDAELEMLGYARDEYVGHHVTEFHADRDVIDDIMVRLSRKETLKDVEARLRRKDGSIKNVLISSNALIRDGKIVHTRCITRDISERKRAEDEREEEFEAVRQLGALHDRRARQAQLAAQIGAAFTVGGVLPDVLSRCCRAAVEALDVAFARIWTVDQAGENLELQASAGLYTRIDGSHARVPIGHHKIGLIAQERKAHLTNDVAFDTRISDPDWARREGMKAFAGYPLIVENRLVGVFAMFAKHALPEDTLGTLEAVADTIAIGIERKRAEIDRERLFEELSRTVRFSEMFTGILAHDLRNPLSAISTSASLLSRLDDSDRVGRAASRILRSSDRMARMITQLLDFTRIRLGGGIPLSRAEADLGEICRTVVEELAPANGELEFRAEIGPDLAGIWDRDRLVQLVSNLVGNACQHSKGDKTIVIRAARRGEEGVELEVENQGVIPPDLLPVLFEPLRSADSNRQSGLGLGLYISREIVLGHGGSIRVQSDVAIGTRFRVELPLGSVDSTGSFGPSALGMSGASSRGRHEQ